MSRSLITFIYKDEMFEFSKQRTSVNTVLDAFSSICGFYADDILLEKENTKKVHANDDIYFPRSQDNENNHYIISIPAILKAENIFVMTESRAVHQDIRPLHVLILNLMPKKIETETQILRKLSNTPLQIEVDLLRIDDHVSKNTPKAHIDTFYQDFDHVKDKYYDGLIITGAPLGKVPFEQVSYWDTLVKIMILTIKNVIL